MSHEDKLCMYFWIVQGPGQKKMRKGKAAGQVAHAAARLARMMTDEEWEEYLDYEVKIVYKVRTTRELIKLSEIARDYGDDGGGRSHLVYDETWGTHTVYGLLTRDDPNKDNRWKLA